MPGNSSNAESSGCSGSRYKNASRRAKSILLAAIYVTVAVVLYGSLPYHPKYLGPWLAGVLGRGAGVFVEEFSRTFLLTAVLLHVVLLIWFVVAGAGGKLLKGAWVAMLASLAVATLRAEDAFRQAQSSFGWPSAPKSLAELAYVMLFERQTLMAFSFLVLLAVAYVLYKAARALFTVEYDGGGLRVRLPGHVVYYFPVFPQTSWQDTGIKLKEGEKIEIHVTGQVSPGAMHYKFLKSYSFHMDELIKWQKDFKDKWEEPERKSRWRNIEGSQPKGWKYTDPGGYKQEDYKNCVDEHPLYGKVFQHCFYEQDRLLTITGLPHNRVVGFIKGENDGPGEPHPASGTKDGYEWSQCKDDSRFLSLSSDTYPIERTVGRTGTLWVVINDVDVARWDNTGLFLMKITKRSLF